MVKKQSLKNNFIFQFVYQIVIFVIPLFESPFLTRRLGSENLGIFTYTNSIANYFVIFAMLGILKYGQRVIAQRSNDEYMLRKTFWSLFAAHTIFSTISFFAYLAFAIFFVSSNKTIFLIESVFVLSALFDITWLFYGLENFKSVVFKNIFVRVSELVLVLLFIKSKEDLWIFTTITASSSFIGFAILLPQAIRTVKPIRFSFSDIKEHFKPLLFFSISVIAISLYTILDKTLLGIFSSNDSVAYYEYANKIITIPKMIITVLGTVMLPRACSFAAKGEYDNQKKYLHYSLVMTSFIAMSSIFGLLSIGQQLTNLYYGSDFSLCGPIIMSLTPLIAILGFGDIVRTQFMIPNKMDNQYILCSVLNAVVNIVFSVSLLIILPDNYKVYGAVVGTCAAELFGCVFQIIICRKFISPWEFIKTLIPFSIIGAIMFLAIKLVAIPLDQGIVSLLIQIGVGAFVFVILSLLYIFFFEKDIWGMTVGKIFKKKKV